MAAITVESAPDLQSRRHPLVRRARKLAARIRQAGRFEIYAFWRHRRVRADKVMYESFAGNGMLCNPEAIFRALLDDDEFAHLQHVWVLRDAAENQSAVREFTQHPRVRFVGTATPGYYRALATSGYLINNATFPPEFSKRAGQVYLNTWHGTPLKKMGYDIGDPASRVGNVIRNFLSADFLLAANRFMVDQMYESAHLLKEIFTGKFIEEGYPRVDRQFVDKAGADRIRTELEKAHELKIGGREIILYAPTWKGTNFNDPHDDIAELVARVAQIESLIDTNKYVVLLKTHQVVHKYVSRLESLQGRLVPNEVPTNSVLAVTDVLITDYSSIFFDFLATNRPILFLTPDISDYAGYRGLYLEPSSWPGPVLETVEALAAEIALLSVRTRTDEIAQNYEAMRERFSSHEDGNATARVVDIVFRKHPAGYRVYGPTKTDRKTILINAGRFWPNGISASLVNLFTHLDYDRFDVSVVFTNNRNRLVLENQRQVDSRVRQFARVGGMNGSKFAHMLRRLHWMRGDLRSHSTGRVQRKLWDDEWTRCFGATTFDYVVDFSGYGPFWAILMLHAPGAVRSIWMHNDLLADAHRTTGGKRKQLRDLRGIFTLYRQYDHLVSVSPALERINSRSLASHATPHQFSSAMNLVNADRVTGNAMVPLSVAAVDDETGHLPAWARDMIERPQVPTFVTVGRLSPEKNHARLLRAFARVHDEDPSTRLVIVGSGPLEGVLSDLILQLGLTGSAWLAGHQRNPHAIMASAQFFVLSSDYEGQPMVILEARIVGLPVVSVDFGSIRDALPEGTGLVVPSSVDGLTSGMLELLNGRVRAVPFESTTYNRSAEVQFYEAIGAETSHRTSPSISENLA